MIRRFLKRLIATHKEFILSQVLAVKDLMRLLMKHRNTGEKWTREEIREIRTHLKHIAKLVPVLIIFLLPGGSLLLPILAEVLDRRKKIRRPPEPSSYREPSKGDQETGSAQSSGEKTRGDASFCATLRTFILRVRVGIQ